MMYFRFFPLRSLQLGANKTDAIVPHAPYKLYAKSLIVTLTYQSFLNVRQVQLHGLESLSQTLG